MSKKDMLINNGLDWYVVTKLDGEIDLQHETQLSAIIQCGHNTEDYGIEKIERCWGGEDLGDLDD